MKAAKAAGLALVLALPAAAHGEDPGRKIFLQVAQPSCAVCHALQAAGATGTIGPSLDELKPDRERVIQAVREGLGVMPPFKDTLSARDIEAVAEFVARAAAR